MNEKDKTRKSIKSVVIFGLILAGWNLIGGAAILILDFPREVHSQWPLWKFGQYSLFMGIINSCVFVFLLFAFGQFQKLPPDES